MQVLGKNVDMTNPEWVNEVCDMIADAKEREAINDMSMLAHALVTEIAFAQDAAEAMG